jgi:hypothetical protein
MVEPEINENSKYWQRIRKNIKKQYKEGYITQRYSYEDFCNNFVPDERPLTTSIRDKCICDHDIIHNYKYNHKDNEDYFILGSCCIKKFSTVYKQQRECIDCGKKIRKNDDNRCKECRETEKERLEYIEKCKCKGCKVVKKDDKYKYCYKCKYGDLQKEKTYNKCTQCGIKKKEDTYRKCYKCNNSNRYDPIEDNIRVALDSWD